MPETTSVPVEELLATPPVQSVEWLTEALSSRAKRGIWVLHGGDKNRDSSSLALLGMTTSWFGCGPRRGKLRLRGVVALSIFLFCATFASANSWRVSDFKDNISIHENGSADVSERITLTFVGEWHGIHRFIPIEYPGPQGTNYTLFLNVTAVTDPRGPKEPVKPAMAFRVQRGGAWIDAKSRLRSASRGWSDPSFGSQKGFQEGTVGFRPAGGVVAIIHFLLSSSERSLTNSSSSKVSPDPSEKHTIRLWL